MSEQRYREIQLTAKQLVFLFMAAVVVAVSIFLLGVSVGRGVRGTSTQASVEPPAAPPGALEPPASMPPETKLTPADVSYHARLQERPADKPAAPPSSEPVPAPVAPARGTPPAPASSEPARASAPAPAGPAAQTAGGWFVQTGAFSTRANADKHVAELKGKGHAAFVVTPGQPFRVRIGPLARAAADRLAAQLQAEGLKPSVTR